jgi:enediyne biosynthesis protein E4
MSSCVFRTVFVALLLCATPARSQTAFQSILDESDSRLLHADWNDLLSSPLGDEMPFMIGGVCQVGVGPDTRLVMTRASDPPLLLNVSSDSSPILIEGDLGSAISESGCASGDIDGDGRPDLVLLSVGNGANVFTSTGPSGSVSFELHSVENIPPGNTTSAFLGDYDNDGDLDMVILQWSPTNGLVLFENDGTGGFGDVTSKLNLGAAVSWGFAGGFADINNDGWLDMLIVSDFGSSKVFLNDSGKSFEDVTAAWNAGTDRNGMGSAIGDIDGDGDLDWFITSIFDSANTCSGFPCQWGASGNRLYINEGGTQFRDATDEYGVRDGGWGWGASFLDYDNDGDLDLAMTNGVKFPDTPLETSFNNDPLRLWRNDGAPPMVEVSAAVGFVDTRPGKGLTVFDLGQDGDLDVLVVNNADYPVLLENVVGNANSWLRVDLKGVQSNAQGFGARIYVTPASDGPTMMHEVNANSNYMSQNESTAHFGLGSHVGTIAEVRVSWPASGIETLLREVDPMRTILVSEKRMGDLNSDAGIDLRDVAMWLNCQGRAGVGLQDPQCAAGDFNTDGEIDARDWRLYTALLQSE